MRRLLNPTNDWMFKRLFGEEKRKDLTIHLINTLLEGTQPPVVDITFLPVELDKETVVLRPSIVDVLCQAEDGRQFIVEMQRASDTYFIQRIVEYTCQVYLNQHLKALKEPGDRGGYCKMHPVVCLAIMETTIFKQKSSFLSHHEFRDILTHEHDIKELSFTFLELSKFHKSFEELETDLDRWAYYFCHATDTSPDQFETICEENSVFSRAYQALVEAACTPEELLVYLRFGQKQAEIEIQNEESWEKGLAKGLEQGKAEGLAEGKREIAFNLLACGMPFEQIAKITGLSEDEVRKIRKESMMSLSDDLSLKFKWEGEEN